MIFDIIKKNSAGNVSPLYIYLDVDGVLNSFRQWNSNFTVEEENVKALEQLVKDTHGRIVLSSTWRSGYDKINHKHTEPVQNLIDALRQYDMEIFDITPTYHLGERCAEIKRHIRLNDVTRYIVLDDDMSIFKDKELNIYEVNYETGLTLKDVKVIEKKYLSK